jgi:hypothetical protein
MGRQSSSQDDADRAHEASVNTIMLIVDDEGQRGVKNRRPCTGGSQQLHNEDVRETYSAMDKIIIEMLLWSVIPPPRSNSSTDASTTVRMATPS